MVASQSRPPVSTRPVTIPKSGRVIRTPATAAPVSGSKATAHTTGSICGCSR